mgnify:CR=1 FL=1
MHAGSNGEIMSLKKTIAFGLAWGVALSALAAEVPLVSNRVVSVVQTPRAEFVLLDACLEGPVYGDEAAFTLRQWDYYVPRPATKPENVRPEWRERVKKNDGSQWRLPLRAPTP